MGLVAKAFQDIITFSRASSGTYVNSNGYITNSSVLNYLTYSNQPENAAWTKSNSFVQQNLLTYSQELDNAAWSKVGVTVAGADINATIAPDGTLTAEKIAEDATTSVHSIYQVYSAVSGTIYTMSFYAKAAERTWVRTRGEIGINYFNLAAGTVGTTAGGVTATIIAVGNGWYRCIATKAAAITGVTNSQIAPTTADNVDSYAGTAGSGIYVWGAQLVQGSVPGDYRATTTAALPVLYPDYNGALRARKLCEDAANSQHYWSQTTAVTAGFVYTVSFRAKAAEKTQIVYTWSTAGAAFNAGAATFNLSAGTVTPSGAATGTITALGSGWYLCTTTNTCVTTSAASAHYLAFTALTTYVGDGTSGVYIADVQVNDGSSALAYYDTTASAYNAPRFDYDPVTLAAKGLLVEESRANLLLRSSDYATSWTASRATVTSNAVLSPDGTATADKLVATAVAGTHRVYQGGITNSGTTTRTLSAYFKAAEYSYAGLMLSDATESDQVRVQWNLATGASTVAPVGTTITLVSSSMQNLSNGWVRCIMTCTVDTTEPSFTAWLFVIDNANASSFTGDGVSGVYAWGAQCETGAFATSYIPTVASQVTRAADVASVNTLSPWFNSVAGTLYVEALANASSPSNQYLATINDGTTNNRVTLFKSTGGAANSRFTVGGVANNPTSLGSSIAGIISKTAITYSTAASGVNIYSNGTAGTAVTAAATPTGMLRLGLGIDETGSTSLINGHLRRVTYYPRQMTSAEGVALTTL